MSASNDNPKVAEHGATNPYAAPHAELAETSPKLSARDVLRSVIFRRRVLMVLGVVRTLGGLGLLILASQERLETEAKILAAMFGLYNIVAGAALGDGRDWARKAIIVECLVQIAAAIVLATRAANNSQTLAHAPVVLSLIPLVWNSANIRLLASQLTRSACQRAPLTNKIETAEEGVRRRGDAVLMAIGLVGVLVFALVGVVISMAVVTLTCTELFA